jgi:nucleoside-diphosphate-sugar epimerase
VTGRQPEVIYNREVGGGIARLVADTGRAQTLLGFRPRVSLREGLRRLLAEDPRLKRRRSR